MQDPSQNLARHAAELAYKRDEYQVLYNKFGDRADLGRASAYRDALAMLHRATNGEYGQSLGEQSGGAS